MQNFDDEPHSLDDWEDPEVDDEEDEDTAETLTCPACGEEVYEDAQHCPYCGEYVTHDSSALSGRPGWFIALGVLGVLAAILVLLVAY
jgi:predicted RNA-binding Zn-ribbon protein involved in translation (DUF1610 family)